MMDTHPANASLIPFARVDFPAPPAASIPTNSRPSARRRSFMIAHAARTASAGVILLRLDYRCSFGPDHFQSSARRCDYVLKQFGDFRAQRHVRALESREDAILEVPSRIRDQVGKVMRVADILGTQAGMDLVRELEDLVMLQLDKLQHQLIDRS